jgi:hypothetical protein
MSEPQTDLTAEEAFESLNGYEEIGITKAFGAQVTKLAETEPTMFARALVFAMERRRGLDHDAAKAAAMERPLSEIDAYFTEEPEELDEEEPESEVGKGDSSPAS